MQMIIHDMVATQKRILDLPAAERRAAMLRDLLGPFEPMLKIVCPPGMDPLQMCNLMRPDGPEAEYRAALETIEAAGTQEACKAALERALAAFAQIGHQPPIAQVHFGLYLLDVPNPVMKKLTQDYTGFGGIPGYIMVNFWPNEYTLPRMGAATVHEFNHNVRNTFEPFTMDLPVGQYVVLEGLAESFAAELYGPELLGPWVTEISKPDLEKARLVIGEALDVRGFGAVRGYIFGDEVMAAFGGKPIGVPAYGGYAVGYHLVQAYLRKTGKTVAEATLTPSTEIIRTADFF